MAEFIRIGHHFINVDKAEHIEVQGLMNGNVSVVVNYRDHKQGIYIENDINAENLDVSVSEAIEEAIYSLCDSDCEDVGQYLEEVDLE